LYALSRIYAMDDFPVKQPFQHKNKKRETGRDVRGDGDPLRRENQDDNKQVNDAIVYQYLNPNSDSVTTLPVISRC